MDLAKQLDISEAQKRKLKAEIVVLKQQKEVLKQRIEENLIEIRNLMSKD